MNPLKILSPVEYLRIPSTPLYVSTRALTLKCHVARPGLDAFTQYDFISGVDYQDALDNGVIRKVGEIGPDLSIRWDDSTFSEGERLAVLEARNSFRREHGLTPITLDDCFLTADEAVKAKRSKPIEDKPRSGKTTGQGTTE